MINAPHLITRGNNFLILSCPVPRWVQNLCIYTSVSRNPSAELLLREGGLRGAKPLDKKRLGNLGTREKKNSEVSTPQKKATKHSFASTFLLDQNCNGGDACLHNTKIHHIHNFCSELSSPQRTYFPGSFFWLWFCEVHDGVSGFFLVSGELASLSCCWSGELRMLSSHFVITCCAVPIL